jgi:tRNA-specific 2-thiouridylase
MTKIWNKHKHRSKIFVGVSGGVDSSVAAALLKEQGHNVVGVFIRTWQPDWIECTWKNDRRDAMRVCAHLDIPFVELNLEDAYKEGVANYMIAEYKTGRTPNPDVMCNKEVKFGAFLDWAIKQGADAVATGHYAQIKEQESESWEGSTSKFELLRGVDTDKDQAYFLWTLTQNQLKHILFPVGHLSKNETRKLAEKFGLPTARKKDSQGICFIGKISMKEFLSHYIEERSGEVLDETSEVIGQHPGALFFTLGERHGFTITKKGTDDGRYYVVAKDIKKNTITVGSGKRSNLNKDKDLKIQSSDLPRRDAPPQGTTSKFDSGQHITLVHLNMISEPLRPGRTYDTQIRYHGEIKKMSIIGTKDDTVTIVLQGNDPTIAPGQSFVIYDGDVCLGGGVIDIIK